MRALVVLGVVGALGALAYSLRARVLPSDEAGPGRESDWLDDMQGWTSSGGGLEVFDPNDARAYAANVAAFLLTIRAAEGTADANGYRALFGHKPSRPRLFDSFGDHPRIAQQFTAADGRRLWTSAAGAYQFMAVSPLPDGSGKSTRVDTWDRLKARLRLEDFSPASQDAAAVELIREAGALALVQAGRFEEAVAKVRGVWASLPGAGYAQPERSLAWLRDVYVNNGGVIA